VEYDFSEMRYARKDHVEEYRGTTPGEARISRHTPVSLLCSPLSALCLLNHRTHLDRPFLPARSLRPPAEQAQPLQNPHQRAHLGKKRRGELVRRVEGGVALRLRAEGEGLGVAHEEGEEGCVGWSSSWGVSVESNAHTQAL
jgi:hypothetical protein